MSHNRIRSQDWSSLRFLGTCLALGTGCLLNLAALAQQQFQGTCAQVKIVIAQELTLERIGFDATLEVSNNDGNDPITDFSANLSFENPLLSTNGVVDDSSAKFFVRSPTFESVNSVGGDGVIAPTTKAVIHWFIIPKISAGGTSPDGVRYMVGCTLAGKIRGSVIPTNVMFAVPAQIFVKPEPQLEITYFQPRDVQGDDPFTPQVESPIPFTLGVLVKNSGYGVAHHVNINSQQPKIVENRQGLLLVAQLLGARVNDSALNFASLNVNLGDIPPGQTRKGAWDMITSLSGEFIEFKASYTHASDLGGTETSVIKSLNAYFIAHEVVDDQPGRDSVKDFLADTSTNDTVVIPNAIFESEGDILPVNQLTNAAFTGSAAPGATIHLNLTADKQGWGYMQLDDPGQALLPVATIVRSDGKVLNTNNYWTSIHYTPITNVKRTYLNILDLVDLKNYTYDITYGVIAADTTPPVTTMRFAGAVTASGNVYYITPDTQIYFTADDASPVSMFYSVTNGPFVPAVPFSLPDAGTYPVIFYSVDTFGNREANNTNIVVVSGSGTFDFANVITPSQPMFAVGDALSIRPYNAPLSFTVMPDPSQVDAQLEIFQGVVAWATVSGVPSSPITDTSASLRVGGDFVDFYKYSLNGGAWTTEQPVSSLIALSGLSTGSNYVSVIGRSQYGGYFDPTNAVTVAWIIDPAAPTTRITNIPATPSRLRNPAVQIGGTGVTQYRWTINNDYYRAPSNAPAILPLTITSATQQLVVLQIRGSVGGVFQATNNPTTATWLFDQLFGYNLPNLPRVRTVAFTNVGTAANSFVWDGRNDAGGILPQGAYTARLTIQDQLHRTNFSTRLIQLSNPAGSPVVLAASTRGPKNPYARGNWAVWEDQSDGNWEIYAQDLSANNGVVKITNTPLSQENPRTDGRYVVWQGRQSNGSWDVFLKDLTSVAPAQPITSSSTFDEVNAVVEWPWVVFQRRATGSATAPWSLVANNLVTSQRFAISPSTQDQLDPDIQGGRVVWQDWRDTGPGEIYYANLESGEVRRITTNTFGQYHPAIFDNWIVWQDTRNGEVDLYGFDLLRNAEIRVSTTPENEVTPYLDGPWCLALNDAMGPGTQNLRLIHLPTLKAVPITGTSNPKANPALAGRKAVWLDSTATASTVLSADLPALQSVFQNQNAVPVTDTMVTYQQNAFALLTLWNSQAAIQQVSHYKTLVPQVVSETAFWTNGAPSGINFTLRAGDFLWIKFADNRVIDLGLAQAGVVNLTAGVNLLSYSAFPNQYSAYKMLNQLGANNAKGLRMLDSQSGLWRVAEILNGRPVGVDFTIPRVAVVMLDLTNPVNNFQPQ